MLKHIHLENFKAQQAADLDFSKINVLTGFNSTGKTTVIQSLAFIKQSLQKKELSFNDYLLRLGDYREVVSRHDTDLPIRISVTLDEGGEELRYGLEASMGGVVESFAVDGEEGWKWDSRTDGAVEASGRLFFPIAAGGYGGGVFMSSDPVKTMQEQKRAMGWFENMLYLSSNRGFTKYNYPLLAGKPTVEDISNRTGDSSALEEWLSNLIIYRINEAKRYPAMEAQLNRMTDRLSSLGVEISPYVMSGPSVVIDLAESGMWVSAVNSGYGVNQSVASIVLGSLSEPGSLVMIEEPETHLHPRFQRTMAQILADFTKEGKQVLITSHSDHVLQELRKLVLAGKVPEEDVKVYHFAKEDRTTRASEIDVTDEAALRELFS
ncbi:MULTISPECIES: AAA family ATPase [Gordonibacter]|uniref:AAA family ATPase n=1 Tax=Gordonibacter TaxID=644652 RepID=UPI0026342C14|nr:AAA family ATPase [Gordonibacter sp. RACS_AR49]MDN4509477.1 AAA family ATPase [Gordonibacter sp. RACS_AR49]